FRSPGAESLSGPRGKKLLTSIYSMLYSIHNTRLSSDARDTGGAEGRRDAELKESAHVTHAEAGIHPDRAARRHCPHCHPGGDPLPRLCPGPREGPADDLYLQHEAVGPGHDDVCPGP